MSTILELLWRNRLTTLVANLATGEREHEEIANLARHIGADYAGRFLIELIQNANDQARLVGRSDSTVMIVRTLDLVAVTNEGKPFDEPGIRAITSLGVSPKDAAITIGNKGIGFKAVFEVTDAPEIYSAMPGHLDGQFDEDGGSWFRLHSDPLGQAGLRERLKSIAAELMEERPQDAAAIRAQTGRLPVEVILEAVGHSAPFRYPIGVDRLQLTRRLEELRLPAGFAAQTLVAVPLLREASGGVNPEAERIVQHAIREFLRHGDAIALFLDGVREIVLEDRVSGKRHVLRRDAPAVVEPLLRGSTYLEVVTRCGEVSSPRNDVLGAAEDERTKAFSQRWLVTRRTIGEELPGHETRAREESAALNEAARKLPGKNWSEVRTAVVSVAISISQDDDVGGRLESDGLLCIGLPTLVQTGTPLWVDARFHGNVSRTEVYWNQMYNRRLLDEAMELVADLVARLKTDDSPARRRLAALALAAETPLTFLGKKLYAPDGLAAGEVILSRDGAGYLSARDLALPAREDQEQFQRLVDDDQVAAARGFLVPDSVLFEHGRQVLERFPGYTAPPARSDTRFVKRPANGASLIEIAAERHRMDGPGFWEPFLHWLIDRYRVEELGDQRVLPVGRGDLAAPDQRVFYRPWTPAPGVVVDEEMATGADEGEEENLGALPDGVRDALAFLDETAVRIREDRQRKRTDLGARLAPERHPGLVRAPRRMQLINDLVVPRMLAIAARADGHDDLLGLALLKQALIWTSLIKPGTADDNGVKRSELLVPVLPVSDGGRRLEWMRPVDVYLGHGWLDGRRDELLVRVHGDRPGASLVPWSMLAELVGSDSTNDEDRTWWRESLLALGVADRPRLLRRSRIENALCLQQGSFQARGQTPSPWAGVAAMWPHYLQHVAHSRSQVGYQWGDYHLEEVTWVDGLERSESRVAAVELMLCQPEAYETALSSYVVRDSRRQRFEVESLWHWALRSGGWKAIPLSEGYGDPHQAWLLESDQRSDLARFRLLPSVPQRFDPARRLLTSLGVCTLADAPAERLIEALHELASRLPMGGQDERSARSLAADLYGRLANLDEGHGQPKPQALRLLRQRAIPVLHAGALTAADPSMIPVLYIDDDPVRRVFLGGLEDLYSIPLRNDTSESRLAVALREALGPDRVALTSCAAVDTGFTPSGGDDALLLDYLEKTFPGVTVDLALLIAYGGRVPLDPSKGDFTRHWELLKRTLLRRGRFRPGFPRRSFFEDQPIDAPCLLVDRELPEEEILGECWSIIGIAYRDLWAAYSHEVRSDPEKLRRFFSERRVGDAERHEIESMLGQGWAPHLQAWRPVFLALWRRRHPDAAIEEFHAAWGRHADHLAALASWLGVPELESILAGLRGVQRDDAIERIVSGTSLPWSAWQAALHELGIEWRFESAVREFSYWRCRLWATLAASAARLGSVDLAEAKEYLVDLEELKPPQELVGEPAHWQNILSGLIERALQSIAVRGLSSKHERMVDRLRRIRTLQYRTEELLGEPSKREVNEFANFGSAERLERAAEAAKNYWEAVRGIAGEVGEEAAVLELSQDERLQQLGHGYFASRYSFLPELSARLTKLAPETFGRLSRGKAFDEVQPRSALARFYSAPAGSSTGLTEKPAARRLIGVVVEEAEIMGDLKKGGAGVLGAALQEATALQTKLDLLRLMTRFRGLAPEPPTRTAGGRKGSARPPRRPSASERELLGLLGEAFIYELLCRLVAGFSYSAWISENSVRYGVKEVGDDSFGCDFRFFDEEAVLSVTANTECFIEVKSTAGDSASPFTMSFNEWLRAEECHGQLGKLYIVARVIEVDKTPKLLDLLVNPVQLEKEGRLKLADQDLWAYVGEADTNPT